MELEYHDIAKMIDHSLLPPMLTTRELREGCELALAYDVASVCIMPHFMSECTKILEGSTVAPSTTIGFPHGAHMMSTKLAEAERAIEDGCQELDVVTNFSRALSGDWDYVQKDLEGVIQLAHAANRKVKVIFENCYLEDEHKIKLCQICNDLKADWVKTSTGFGTGGATIEDLTLMREHAAADVQVKAAGGVRDLPKAIEVRALGVSRIGASRTPQILDPLRSQLGLPEIRLDGSSTEGY